MITTRAASASPSFLSDARSKQNAAVYIFKVCKKTLPVRTNKSMFCLPQTSRRNAPEPYSYDQVPGAVQQCAILHDICLDCEQSSSAMHNCSSVYLSPEVSTSLLSTVPILYIYTRYFHEVSKYQVCYVNPLLLHYTTVLRGTTVSMTYRSH